MIAPKSGQRFEACRDDLFATVNVDHALQYIGPEQRLHARGAFGRCAFLVVSGIVRFERVTAAGTRRIVRIAGKGDLIGQEAILRQAYRDDAITCTTVALRPVSTSVLDVSNAETGRLLLALMSLWQETLDQAEFWATEVAAGPSRRRMLQLLGRLNRHRDTTGQIWLPKREQMSDMLNMTIETCSRVVSKLRRDRVLLLVPPRQAIVDEARLASALVQFDSM